MRKLFLVLLLLTAACSPDPSHSFRLDGWSKNEEKIITSAINEWGSDITIDETSDNTIIKDTSLDQLGYIHYQKNAINPSFINISMNGDYLKKTTKHEIGHILACFNNNPDCHTDLGPGHVMSSTTDQASDRITYDDYIYAFGYFETNNMKGNNDGNI